MNKEITVVYVFVQRLKRVETCCKRCKQAGSGWQAEDSTSRSSEKHENDTDERLPKAAKTIQDAQDCRDANL